MGLAKQFNDVIESQLNVFAAWLPITNTFHLGDYGIVDDGVFAKQGNIKEFGVTFIEGLGKEASLDFTSDSTRVINFAAGAEVDVIPDGAIDAKVTFKFQKERSFLLKSPVVNVNTIENVNEVGTALMAHPKWQKKFKVVHQTYFAKEAAVMTTIDKDTEITFTGDVKALQKLNVGHLSVGFTSNTKLGLDLHGAEGVVGLGLFRIKKGGIFGLGKETIDILSTDAKSEALEIEFVSPKDVENDL